MLCLYGSIPSPINGKVYKIPIELWVPHEYPIASPYVYVVPTEKMVLQPGNHVDNNGKCYLPYLANWGNNQEDEYGQSTIVKLCECLSKIFSNEPPVFAKPKIKTPTFQNLQVQSSNSHQTIQSQSPAPALPPKLKDNESRGNTDVSITPMSPPPLPPLPEELRSRAIASPTLNRMDVTAQQRSINQINEIDTTPRYKPFEQPNIMDNDSSTNGGGDQDNNNERLQVLSQLEHLLNQINQFEITQDLNKFNSNIEKIKYSISKFDKIFQYEYHNLDQTNQQLRENEEILKNSIANAENVIQNANSYDQINVDEVICAETVVFNQWVF